MRYRVPGGVTAIAIVLFLAACGGGGSSGSGSGGVGTVPIVSPTATPTPTPTPMPTSGSENLTTSSKATSAPLPPVGGFTGTIQLPPASTNANLQLLESTTPPSGVRAIMARSRDAESANTPYLYFQLVSSDTFTLSGTLGFTLTLPSSVPAQQSFYLAAFFDGTWGTIAGPVTPANGTISLSSKATLNYAGTPDEALVLGLYAGSQLYQGTPVVVQPTSIALMDLSATQTLTIGGADPNATYTVDATQCAGIATATQTSPTTYTVGASALGTCNLIVSDNHGNSVSVFVSVTSTSVVIQ